MRLAGANAAERVSAGMQEATERIVFLLGSGISRHAGYPSMAEITERVLSGSGVYLHSDGTFRFGSDPRLVPGSAAAR